MAEIAIGAAEYIDRVRRLADLIREAGLDRGRIGAELGAEQRLGVTQDEFGALRDALPDARIVDAAPLLWRLRMIKSPAEQAWD